MSNLGLTIIIKLCLHVTISEIWISIFYIQMDFYTLNCDVMN